MPSVLGHQYKSLFHRGRRNQRIEPVQTVRFRVSLKESRALASRSNLEGARSSRNLAEGYRCQRGSGYPGMPARWSAAAFLEIEESLRKIMGLRDLWALKAILDGSQPATRQAAA
jgi:hypothetical protein